MSALSFLTYSLRLPDPDRCSAVPQFLSILLHSSRLFRRRERAILEQQLRDLAGTAETGISQEALTNPIANQVEVAQARYARTWSPGIAAVLGRGKHADRLDVRQVDTLDQHIAPSRLHGIQQILQVPLIFARVAQVKGVKLLECMDQRSSLGRNPRVDGLCR